MTGFNLPPGCNVSDLPGNTPEDVKQEAIEDSFFQDKITDKEWKLIEDGDRYDIVRKAIWYGYEIRNKEQSEIDAENKYYESDYRQRIKVPKLRKYFKELRYTIDYLKSELSKFI